jgi:hypothetical protein
MAKRLFILLFFFAAARLLPAQLPFYPGDSLTISLLTCAPGDMLYSKFGHSAIRVYAPLSGTDLVFNYGLFDFRTPNFYGKFIRGKLPYQLGVQRFDRFVQEYQYDGRKVVETPLALDAASRARVLAFLENNYRPENREYLYDFFYDNCASRIRDVLEEAAGMGYRPAQPEGRKKTYRQLLHTYLQDSPWIKFGIDLILGMPTDQRADFRAEMFLPDYLLENLRAGQVGAQRIMGPDVVLVPARPQQGASFGFLTPTACALLLLFLSMFVTLRGTRRVKAVLDTVLFSAAGLAGALFVFMWAGTDHEATHRNLNLLWANPLALAAPFLLEKPARKPWFALLLLCALTTLPAFFGVLPQTIPFEVLPIALALAVRYADRMGYRFKKIL